MTFLTRIPSAVVDNITANLANANIVNSNVVVANIVGSNRVQLRQPAGSNLITLEAPASFANYTLTFPINDGEANYVLQTDGTGVLSWSPLVSSTFEISDITQADPGAVTTASAISFANNQPIILYGVEGMSEVNNRNLFAGNVAANGLYFELYTDSALSNSLDTTTFNAYTANGVVEARSVGVPGGANTNIQFNDDSAFGGSAALTFDKTSNTLITSAITANGNISFTGNRVSLGAVGNLRISGGSNLQILQTDGNGNLSWANLAVSLIANGNSNVRIANAGGNVTVSATGNANIITVTGTGVVLGANSQTTIANSNIRLATANVSLGTVSNLHILGGAASAATADTVTLVDDVVDSIGVATDGSGYTTAPRVTITGDGIGAAAIATINANGNVTGITVTSGGSGYTTATATISAPTTRFLKTDGSGGLAWNEVTVDNISNVASNVTIAAANGNVTFGVAGNANVLTVTGTTSIANSFTSNNYILGNSTTTISTQRWFGAATANSDPGQLLYQASAASIASMDFHITATEGSNSRQVSKLLVVNLGTETSYTEYGGMWVGPQIVDLYAEQLSGNIRILANPLTASTIQYNIVLTTYNN